MDGSNEYLPYRLSELLCSHVYHSHTIMYCWIRCTSFTKSSMIWSSFNLYPLALWQRLRRTTIHETLLTKYLFQNMIRCPLVHLCLQFGKNTPLPLWTNARLESYFATIQVYILTFWTMGICVILANFDYGYILISAWMPYMEHRTKRLHLRGYPFVAR